MNNDFTFNDNAILKLILILVLKSYFNFSFITPLRRNPHKIRLNFLWHLVVWGKLCKIYPF